MRRVADQWRPASPNESHHIVRQRLFVAPDADALASISATARGFIEMYHRYADEFPREARDGSYEDRIKQTYPIHPELSIASTRTRQVSSASSAPAACCA